MSKSFVRQDWIESKIGEGKLNYKFLTEHMAMKWVLASSCFPNKFLFLRNLGHIEMTKRVDKKLTEVTSKRQTKRLKFFKPSLKAKITVKFQNNSEGLDCGFI